MVWAIKRQGMILEKNRDKLARDKNFAVHRLLQSITRMDYQSLNKPVRWQDNLGEHTGFYHPMDFMHFLVKNLDIPSRGRLYQKLQVVNWLCRYYFQAKINFLWMFHYVKLKQLG